MSDSIADSIPSGEESRQRELLEIIWQELQDLRLLERKYPPKYKGIDEIARLDSLILDIKDITTDELGDNEKREHSIHLGETLKELRQYLKNADIILPKYAREAMSKETLDGLWCLYRVFNNSLNKQLPVNVSEAIEEKSLNTIWDAFSKFREVAIPATQGRGPLPITPTQAIYEEQLKGFMRNFLEYVWKEALGDSSHCLFLDLCIWDPFRIYSKDNWALTNSGINNLGKGIAENFYWSRDNDTFSLLYRSLKKEVLVIVVPPEVSKKQSGKLPEKPYILDAVIEDYIPEDYISPSSAEATPIKQQFEKVLNAHKHFRSDRNIYIHYIPSLFYPKDSGTGIGGIILISKTTFQRKTLVRFQTILDSILSKIGVYHLFENFFDQSVRSAVSSIMARNMSHNIGSHVIPRATVEAVRRRINELKVLGDDEQQSMTLGARSEVVLDLVTALKGNLDEYTQRKSDFLAEITTEPLMTTRPVFFYREVILPLVENTLLMDNIAANEGIQYVDSQRNRLSIRLRINGKELRAKYQCRLCIETGQQGDYVYPDSLPYSLSCIRHPNKRLELRAIENGEFDVEVELPGPLGEFAFYSFMENHIRNSAKHNKECISRDENLDIRIDISDPTNEDNLNFYNVKVWNNVVDPTREINMDVNGVPHKVLWEAISALAASKIIQPDGSLKRQAWGIAEMKICAILLSGPKDFAKALNLQDPKDLTSRRHLTVLKEEIDGEERLVYQFYLMKSRKICAVLPQLAERLAVGGRDVQARERKWLEHKETLKKEGVWIFDSMQELEDALNKDSGNGQASDEQRADLADMGQLGLDSIASFRFALFDCSDSTGPEKEKVLLKLTNGGTFGAGRGQASDEYALQESRASILPKLPFRILALVGPDTADAAIPNCVVQVHEDSETAGLFQMSAGELYQWAWRRWIGRWVDQDKSVVVNVYLDQREDEEPTSKWVKHGAKFNEDSGNVKLDVFGWCGESVESLINVSSDERSAYVIYDRHRQLSSKLSQRLITSQEWAYMILEKHSPDFTTLFSPKFPSHGLEKWTLPWELAEAGLLRILVIDERAAEFSMDEPEDDTTRRLLEKLGATRFGEKDESVTAIRWHMAWAANTFICTHFGYEQEPMELHNRVGNKNSKYPYLKMAVGERGIDLRLSAWGEKEGSLKAEAVLIHQGVLDDCSSRIIGFNQEKFLDRLRQDFPFVVVESGRGIPPTLSEKEKFLPFSRLQHSILGSIVGKFGFSKVLMSLARRVRD